MKRLLLVIITLLFINKLSAQVSPILGFPTVCVGAGSYGFGDATAGGTWTSSNTSAATINATTGVLTPIAAGTTNVVYQVGPSTATIAVTVNAAPNPVTGADSVCVGAVTALSDSGGGTWQSANPGIAGVGSLTGVVTGITYGTALIIYTLPVTGCEAFFTVMVDSLPDPVYGVSSISNIPGGNTTTLYDNTAGGTWSSSNTNFALAGSATGTVTGLQTGLVDITYTLATGCITLAQISINQVPDTNSGSGKLTAWFPFCGYDTSDHTTSGYTLINSGVISGVAVPSVTARPATDRFGSDSSAWAFNNSEMHYSTFIPTTTISGSLTYSCWIYPTATQNSIIMYNGNIGNWPASANGFGFVMNDGTNWVASSGLPYTPAAGQDVSVLLGGVGQFIPTHVNLDEWYNLVITIVGNAWTFYVNDELEGIFTPGPYKALSAPSGSIFALGNDSSLSKPFVGDIDDAGIWNRELSAVEREEVYNFNPDVDTFNLGGNFTGKRHQDTVICTDNITLLPKPQTLGSIYTWGTVNTATFISSVIETTITDTSLNVHPVLTSSFYGTTYFLTISKPFGCSASDTITVFTTPIPVRLGGDTSICKGDTVRLTAHSDSSSAVKFAWSTGSNADSIKVFTSGTYWVNVDSEFYYYMHNGVDSTLDSATCVGRDTVTISVRQVPKVNLGPDVGSCLGKPDTLWNIDSLYDSSSYVYTWSVLTGGDSLIVTTSGTFWLEVNNGGCARYDTAQITIVFDTVVIHDPITRDTAICLGSYIIPIVSINPLPGITYQWTPTDGIALSTIQDPRIVPDTSSWYVLRASYPHCPDILDSIYIDVQPTPTVYIGGNRPVCQYDTIHINTSVSPAWYPSYTYTWTPTASVDDPSSPNVVFTGTDTTKLVLTVSTPFGCSSADSALIIVHPGSFDSQLTNIFVCPGDSVQLMPGLNASGIANGTIASHEWSPGTYLSDSTANAPWVHPVTSLIYTETGTSQYGCHDTLKVGITIYPAATIYLGDSVTITPGQTYTIPTQTNCVSFSWTPAVAINDTSISNPQVDPNTSTKYKVIARSENGCVVEDSIVVDATNIALVSVPNAFAPNTAGINVLRVLANHPDVAINYFRVYDRWGVKVFETQDITAGWDGSLNGKPQPQGVYVYVVEAVNAQGAVDDRQGNVTLLR
jgi:gliding motility-associated-like protein